MFNVTEPCMYMRAPFIIHVCTYDRYRRHVHPILSIIFQLSGFVGILLNIPFLERWRVRFDWEMWKEQLEERSGGITSEMKTSGRRRTANLLKLSEKTND